VDNNNGNVLKTIAHGMSKKKLTKSISQSPIVNWEKIRPIGIKKASNKALNP